jgi:hypothetical protein
MYCRNCGTQANPNAYACLQCGAQLNTGRGFCPNCGQAHDPIAVICVHCGASVANAGFSNAPNDISRAADTAFSFGAQAPGNAIPDELTRGWNWGAFLLPVFWVFWNANTTLRWITVGAAVLAFLSSGIGLGFFLGLGISIYLGLYGNRVAARDRRFSNTEEFVQVQRAWARWGILVLVLTLGAWMLVVLVWLAWAGVLFHSAISTT